MAHPIEPVHRQRHAPLSLTQERLWLLNLREPASSAFNIPMPLRISGELNVEILERSLGEIIRRHEVLRTTFRLNNSEPVQVVGEYQGFHLPVIDLRTLPEWEREDQLRQSMQEEVSRPVDLRTGPLFRALLWRIASEEFALIIVVHHIAFDGWSVQILFNELSIFYEGFLMGKPSPLPEMSLQYADFAIWQRDRLSGKALDWQTTRWKQRLSGYFPIVELPGDYPRPSIERHCGAERSIALSESIADSLRTLSRQEKSPLLVTMLASVAILLHRHTARDQIIIGSPVAGRTRGELEGLIGFFANTLILPIDLSGDPTFRGLVQRTRKVVLEAHAHQDYPTEKLVEGLELEPHLDRNPLVQVVLNYCETTLDVIELSGLKTKPLKLDNAHSIFDLTLDVTVVGKSMRVDLVYNVDKFAEERMEDFLNQFGRLLEQVSSQPDESIYRFSLVTPAAANKLPNPAAPLRSERMIPIHSQFSMQARRVPHRIAIEDPTERWSYQELEARSNQLSHYLCEHGVNPRDIVAIYGHRSASLIWALLGVMKAGAAFIILDPAYPAARLLEFLRAAEPKAYISIMAAGQPPLLLKEFFDGLHCKIELPSRTQAASNRFLYDYPITLSSRKVDAEEVAYIIFTSGSTASPKGIVGAHKPLSHFLSWHSERFNLTEADRFSMLSGLSHDPLLRDIFTPLWLGATVCIPDHGSYLDPDRLLRWLRTERISIAHWTPSLCQLLMHSSGDETLPKLRYAFFGGDVLSKRLVDDLRRIAPSVTAVNGYGATETPQIMGYYVCPSDGTEQGGTVPLGKGIQDVQLLVLNRVGKVTGIGERGQIFVRTAYLVKGYLNDDALTRKRFVVNPLTKRADDICYDTGDSACYLPDGNVTFLGRSDAQVNIRGYRIELGEVEQNLQSHPLIKQATVVVSNKREGQILVAYLVGAEQSGSAINDLREFLSSRLPSYMIPSRFVCLETIPLTPNGKIDYRSLRLSERDWDGVTDGAPPRTLLERSLTKIWCQILELPQIGINDNFFELGGDSLSTVYLQTEIRRDTMIDIPLVAIYQRPTIEGLALYILQQEGKAIGDQEIESVLAELESLTEPQVDQRLKDLT